MVSSPCLSPIGAKLTPYYSNKSANSRMELVILSQPEEQHRARYLTEGSRGAIKDVTGMGHPVVKLNGYYSRQPIKLECYIGHDKHNGLPHLFYQASKISGKNSTQCTACKVEGTSVIVMNLLPEHGMQATIDCIGILKERNVDVEQKLLNLNHHHHASNKMLDFTDDNSYQSAFTSVTSGQQASTTSNGNGMTQVNGCSSRLNNNNHLHHHHDTNSNHSTIGLSKFGRNDGSSLAPSQLDENSIGALSRADSLDDASSDCTRQSLFQSISSSLVQQQIANQANTNSMPATLPKSTSLQSHDNQQMLNHNASTNLLALNSRKRSVRCRLVFRVKIPETGEILQTTSTPIICTQPLGTPEICKKSLTQAPLVNSNSQPLELFIIGKNFLKDSKVVFRNKRNDWIKIVEPEKEFLNSSHLVCKVPSYDGPQVTSGGVLQNGLNCLQQQQHSQTDMIECEVQVRSGGKLSEPQNFYFIDNSPISSQQQQQTISSPILTNQQVLASSPVIAAPQVITPPTTVSSLQSTPSPPQQQMISPPLVQNQPTSVITQAGLMNGHTNISQPQMITLDDQAMQQSQHQGQQQITIYHQPKIESPVVPQLSPPQQQGSPPQQLITTNQQIHAQIQEQQRQQAQPMIQYRNDSQIQQQHQQQTVIVTQQQVQQQQQQHQHQQQQFEQQQQQQQQQQQEQLQQQHQQQVQAIQEQSNQIQAQIMLHQQQQQQHQQQVAQQQHQVAHQQQQTQQPPQQQLQQQQQSVQAAQIQLAPVDLNDENTVVYAESLQSTNHQPAMIQSMVQGSLHSEMQNSLQSCGDASMMGASMSRTEPATSMDQSVDGSQQFVSHFHVIRQQQQQQQHEQQQQQVASTMHQQQYQTTADQQQQQQQQNLVTVRQQQQQQAQFEVIQQQPAVTIQGHQQQQLQQQMALQQHQQQTQQLQQSNRQMVTNLDLTDDSTVVYADNFQSAQADSSTPEALLFTCNFS